MDLRDGRRWPKGFSRGHALKTYVMSCIADDYEEFERVSRTVTRWANEDGLNCGTEEILAQLSELIRTDQARAYSLTSRPPHVVRVDFSEGSTDNVWFMLTPTGLEVLDALDGS